MKTQQLMRLAFVATLFRDCLIQRFAIPPVDNAFSSSTRFTFESFATTDRRRPKKVTAWMVVFFTLVLLAPPALAQRSNGYLLVGGGRLNSKFFSHAAVGGEAVLGKGVGLGAELGVVAGHDSFAAISINGYYHIPNSTRDRKLDPFLTGGYTNIISGPYPFYIHTFVSASAGNFGGGLNYWLFRHLGVRIEFRDFMRSGQLPILRFGITFH